MIPYYLWQDLSAVVDYLKTFGVEFDVSWFAPHFEFRCPQIGVLEQAGVTLEFRQALEPWYVLGEEAGAGGTTRYVDSSLERIQVKVNGMYSPSHCVTVNGVRIPLQNTGTTGEYVGAVRYRAWQPPSCLHPTIPVHTPLVFDLVDTANSRSLGGCRYHIDSPGGLNPEAFPINALEAESRRAARFFRMGHTGGRIVPVIPEQSPSFPWTLDLRRV
jgi:uncharacterized protein (DUF2126 family)